VTASANRPSAAGLRKRTFPILTAVKQPKENDAVFVNCESDDHAPFKPDNSQARPDVVACMAALGRQIKAKAPGFEAFDV